MMQHETKNILFWFKTSPFDGITFREGLDAALSFAAFDQKVTLYFDANALPALYTNINPVMIGQKDISKNLKALPMYDINTIFFNPDSYEAAHKMGIELIASAFPRSVTEMALSDFHQTFVY
ncbi:MAG: DsrE family protein [Hahellaceae bacterium]|nr:DsrE family protein [Hahellaceae bacterium]